MSSVASSRADQRPSRALRRAAAAEGRVVRRGPAQAPPELVSRRLRSRTWRAANSWWLAIPALGLPWLAFLYMGLRGRRPQWVLAALGYLVAMGGAATGLGLGLGLATGHELLFLVLGSLLGAGTWGLGLVHSIMANSTWLRIKAAFTGEPALEAPTTPAVPPAPADPVSGLQEALREVVRTANRHGGRLPDGAVPAVREVEDVLRPLLAHVARRGAEVEELHNLEAIVTEYLPGALEHYLDLPPDYAETHRLPSGLTPAEELVNQLRLLVDGSRDLQRAVHDHDAQKLSVQGRFLDAKFRRSDLDL
ncbi:hypothetical protein [Kineococcus radiotolerans]|uniref:5-bromo-4-chloroindolyl phosphate hydrolysis protein n=1 Tax=Kineococcus radiotolerans (strain ATCC BAA-149 / DSM 14245 / SRS30216) TaxID=266940 RepID=A6WD90_KINRD|nr:hypothetical protein [Kineococcus radiotolerans]ABS04779.1 hypothetical protein Krad_3315 [Kineococcus radiotolerans SRS30216 = ATCC BAA-149]